MFTNIQTCWSPLPHQTCGQLQTLVLQWATAPHLPTGLPHLAWEAFCKRWGQWQMAPWKTWLSHGCADLGKDSGFAKRNLFSKGEWRVLENDDNLTGSPIRPKADWQVSGVHPSPAVQSSSLPQSLARNITAEKGQFCHFWPPLEESSSHRRTLESLSSSAKYWISHQLCDWLNEAPKLKWTGYHIKNFSFAESVSWFGIVTRKHSYTYM